MTERTCAHCSAPLRRKPGERPGNFRTRKTCGHSCAWALPRHNGTWRPEQVAELTQCWNDGISTLKIGRRMWLTKNAVIGKANRMHLTPRENPILRKPATPAIVRAVTRPCQWIDGHPGTGQPWSFCGAECIDGTSWCASHYADVYLVSPAELARRKAIGARLTAARKIHGLNGRAVA